MIVEFDVVYPALDEPTNERGKPSFDFETGTVKVYTSNRDRDEAPPADKTEMTPYNGGNPLTPETYKKDARFKWVLWEIDTGSPVVREFGIIKEV